MNISFCNCTTLLLIPSCTPENRRFMLRRANQLANQVITMFSTRKTPDINLYTTQTPNGIKISITLEELG